jgi:hypothetical protein
MGPAHAFQLGVGGHDLVGLGTPEAVDIPADTRCQQVDRRFPAGSGGAQRGYHRNMARHPIAGSRAGAAFTLALLAASSRRWFRRVVIGLINVLRVVGG